MENKLRFSAVPTTSILKIDKYLNEQKIHFLNSVVEHITKLQLPSFVTLGARLKHTITETRICVDLQSVVQRSVSMCGTKMRTRV